MVTFEEANGKEQTPIAIAVPQRTAVQIVKTKSIDTEDQKYVLKRDEKGHGDHRKYNR